MGEIIKINLDHPLLGTWVTEVEDSSAAFTIKMIQGEFIVTGFDRYDEEQFNISDVVWKDDALYFTSFVPSTNYGAKHVFRLRNDGRVDHELTIFEVWKKIVEE